MSRMDSSIYSYTGLVYIYKSLDQSLHGHISICCDPSWWKCGNIYWYTYLCSIETRLIELQQHDTSGLPGLGRE